VGGTSRLFGSLASRIALAVLVPVALGLVFLIETAHNGATSPVFSASFPRPRLRESTPNTGLELLNQPLLVAGKLLTGI
jgi:hypothetical protein